MYTIYSSQVLVILSDAHSVVNSAALRQIAVSLAENGIKVVPVVVGGRTEINKIRPLTTMEAYIVSVSSADRLSDAIRPTVEKILRGNLCFICWRMLDSGANLKYASVLNVVHIRQTIRSFSEKDCCFFRVIVFKTNIKKIRCIGCAHSWDLSIQTHENECRIFTRLWCFSLYRWYCMGARRY